jgi:secondary thiamine-phosphate synthase enzyme
MPLHRLHIQTTGPGLYDVTHQVQRFVFELNPSDALLTVFVRHTSCFARLVPAGDDPSMSWLAHTAEGPDDMPAHIKAALTQTSIGIPVADGQLMLGTWQGIYLFEHRHRPHRREIVLHLTG